MTNEFIKSVQNVKEIEDMFFLSRYNEGFSILTRTFSQKVNKIKTCMKNTKDMENVV
jgi:hypothetical protein